MPCTERNSSFCDAGHKQSWKCSDGRPKTCPKCEREAKLAKERQEREIEAQRRRDIEQREHLARLDVINAQIDKEHQAQEDARLKQERSQSIKLKENDLAALIASRAEPTVPAVPDPRHPPASAPEASTLSKLQQMLPSPSNLLATASSMLSRSIDGRDVQTPDNASSNSSLPPVKAETTSQMPSSSDGRDVKTSSNNSLQAETSQTTNQMPSSPKPFPKLAESPSKKEWLRQKNMEGASNPSIDAIMDMTGLEEVKKKVLNIKTKIDVSKRQNASLKQERFNAVLLGNPGTGGCFRPYI
jgi:hypothetical protein